MQGTTVVWTRPKHQKVSRYEIFSWSKMTRAVYASTEMAVKNSKFDVQLQVAVDGGQAMVVLRDSKQKALPDLILLDITLPGANGWEILRAIKNDSKLASIPVVVLTASIDERYVQKCYDLQADGFINKPLDVEKLTEILFGGEGFTPFAQAAEAWRITF